jgi:putative endonuclease
MIAPLQRLLRRLRARASRAWSRLRGAKPRTESHRLGAIGEKAAARFLARERGMAILARNWKNPADKRDELDLVCRSPEGVLVFVEVKTYPTARLFDGYATINARKKAVLKRAARAYLRALGPRRHALTHRLDVVVIERAVDGPEPARLIPHHFVNVPLFSK